MKRICLLSWLWLLAVDALAGGKVTVTPVPAWVEPLVVNTESKVNTSEVSDGYLYLHQDDQHHLGLQQHYRHLTCRILSEVGVQNASEIEIVFPPSYTNLELHYVRIIRGSQVIDKLASSKQVKVMQRETQRDRHLYDNSLSAIITLTDVRVGDHIDYAYTIKGTNPVFGGKFSRYYHLQYSDPIDQLRFRVVVPAGRTLHYKDYNQAPAPEITRKGTETVYTWLTKNAAGYAFAPDAPLWYNPVPGVWTSEFNSWSQIGAWAESLFSQTKPLSPALTRHIEQIKEKHSTPSERTLAALRFVQDDIRYLGMEIGVNSYKPYPPSQVFEQRYGDCKDKSLLLSVMLQQMGITANPALVNSTHNEHIKTWLPSPTAFDHCVVRVQLENKSYWFDPTLSHQRGPAEETFFPNYVMALVVGDSNKGLTQIKPQGTGSIHISEMYSMSDIGGQVLLHVKTIYRGVEANAQRQQLQSVSTRDISSNFLNFYNSIFPLIEQDKEIDILDDPEDNVLIVTEAYKISDFWTKDDSLSPFTSEVYPYILRNRINKQIAANRKAPLALEYPLNITQTISVDFPETWVLKEGKEKIEGPGFEFESESTLDGSRVELKYQYSITSPFIEAGDVAKFQALHKKIINQIGSSFSYSAPQAPSTNWMMVAVFVLALLLGGAGSYYLYHSYDPVPSFSEEQGGWKIGGWLVVPAIAVVLNPLQTLRGIQQNSYFDYNVWQRLTNVESGVANPPLAYLMTLELALLVLFACFGVMLAVLFFKRRSSLPRLFMLFLGIRALYLILDALSVSAVAPDTSITDAYGDIIRAIVFGGIWCWYFSQSERVEYTFTKMLRPVKLEVPVEESTDLILVNPTPAPVGLHEEQVAN